MADNNQQKRRTASGSGNIHRRGEGLGTGPVGNGPRGNGSAGHGNASGGSGTQGTSYRPSGSSQRETSGRASGSSSLVTGLLGSLLGGSSKSSGLGKILLIIAAVAVLGGGGTGLAGLLGSGSSEIQETVSTTSSGGSILSGLGDLSSVVSGLGLSGILGGTGTGSFDMLSALTGAVSTGTDTSTASFNTWSDDANTGNTVSETVAEGARAKRTVIKGKGKDTVTIMVYMCGTDLESSYGMATKDLQEMLSADLGSNVNLLVYTGGCKKWKNSTVSASTNEIYQVKGGKLYRISDNEGAKAMVDPSTLSGYIRYCAKNYPANRYELILWDHGGGSVTGYGYDEKYSSSGSMDLSEIAEALKDGGVSFDFVGFDACLMATAETALMLEPYADYMIASEESEPGIGWYYTGWLSALGSNTSLSTVKVGKNIVDDFISECDKSCKGQATTLSVVDLAEFSAEVPEALSAFSEDTTELIKNNGYKTVASARSKSHEFAASSRIDQVDLVHFAKNVGSDAGEKLSDAILGAVKYNKTGGNVTNAYGISIYFPYQSSKYVTTAVKTYQKLGMDTAYGKCIKAFAAQETSGQVAGGGSSAGITSLLGTLTGSSSLSDFYSYSGSSSSYSSSDVISGLLSSFISGGRSVVIDDLDGENTDFLTEEGVDVQALSDQVSENFFDATNLILRKTEEGRDGITLTKEQWSLVNDLSLSVYYDDGEGYIDLGLDKIYELDSKGDLLMPEKLSWLAACDNPEGENAQVVAYYYETMVQNGTDYCITGYIPAYLNDERVKLLVAFDNDHPYGYFTGAERVYTGSETELSAKSLASLEAGDKVDFICDYYTYAGEYTDSYYLGETMTVPENAEDFALWSFEISTSKTSMMYCFEDIYHQFYWSEASK